MCVLLAKAAEIRVSRWNAGSPSGDEALPSGGRILVSSRRFHENKNVTTGYQGLVILMLRSNGPWYPESPRARGAKSWTAIKNER